MTDVVVKRPRAGRRNVAGTPIEALVNAVTLAEEKVTVLDVHVLQGDVSVDATVLDDVLAVRESLIRQVRFVDTLVGAA